VCLSNEAAIGSVAVRHEIGLQVLRLFVVMRWDIVANIAFMLELHASVILLLWFWASVAERRIHSLLQILSIYCFNRAAVTVSMDSSRHRPEIREQYSLGCWMPAVILTVVTTMLEAVLMFVWQIL
jgi:hypothetical protein